MEKDEVRLKSVDVELHVTEQRREDDESFIGDCASDSLLKQTLSELELPSNPTACLLDSPNRDQLEKQYFDNFHPHWPLIQKRRFSQRRQAPELVAAILTAGLSVSESPEMKRKGRFYHDALMNALYQKLVRGLLSATYPL